MESTASAYTLYQRPGLLSGLTQWDGSTLSASQRTVDTPKSTVTQPKYSFDPFDQKTWDVEAPKNNAAPTAPAAVPAAKPAAAPKAQAGTKTGTGVVVPLPKYSFNPFDQKSWDVAPPKGSTFDTSV